MADEKEDPSATIRSSRHMAAGRRRRLRWSRTLPIVQWPSNGRQNMFGGERPRRYGGHGLGANMSASLAHAGAPSDALRYDTLAVSFLLGAYVRIAPLVQFLALILLAVLCIPVLLQRVLLAVYFHDSIHTTQRICGPLNKKKGGRRTILQHAEHVHWKGKRKSTGPCRMRRTST